MQKADHGDAVRGRPEEDAVPLLFKQRPQPDSDLLGPGDDAKQAGSLLFEGVWEGHARPARDWKSGCLSNQEGDPVGVLPDGCRSRTRSSSCFWSSPSSMVMRFAWWWEGPWGFW